MLVDIHYIFCLHRFVARDIGGGDPERMAPPNVEKYIRDLFEDKNIKLDVISDEKSLLKEYPLFAAVNRAASGKYLKLVMSVA